MAQHSVQQQHSHLHDTAPQDVQRYFPLRLGYVWTYAETVMTATQQLVLQRRVTLTMQRRDGDEYIAHWDFQSGFTKLPNMRYRRVPDALRPGTVYDVALWISIVAILMVAIYGVYQVV